MPGTPIYYPNDAITIRDGTAARLVPLGIFRNVYTARTLPTKDDQLPLAAVWIASERTSPNGDGNVGSPSFLHTLTLVIDILAKAPPPIAGAAPLNPQAQDAALDGMIVSLVEATRVALFTDPTWVGLSEGHERADVRYAYPKETNDLLVQAMIEVEVTFRSDWPPYAPNDFLRVMVTTNTPDTPVALFNGYATKFNVPQDPPCPSP